MLSAEIEKILAPDKGGKRIRIVFTDKQSKVLEELFAIHQYPNSALVYGISRDIGITEQQLREWFRGRRKKHKLDSMTVDAVTAQRVRKSDAASNDAQERKANATSNDTQETNANVESTDANKETTSPNVIETRTGVLGNQIQEIGPSWNLAKGRVVMERMIDKYKCLNPSQLMQAHFERSSAVETQQGQLLLRRTEKSEVQNVYNNYSTKGEFALSMVLLRENDGSQNFFDTTEAAIRIIKVMEQMVYRYKGLCPTHLVETHFNKENHKQNTGNESRQSQHTVPQNAAKSDTKYTRFNPEELEKLKALFEKKQYPKKCELKEIANELGIAEKRIKQWFRRHRRRARKQS